MATQVVKQRRGPHAPGCRHCPRVRALGSEFRLWRACWESQLESVACGYETEAAQFRQEHRPPTFKDYLIQMTGAGWPMSGQQPARRFAA